jgi:hypothetical protein
MAEAKCTEVDNKQAVLAQADPGAQPKLNMSNDKPSLLSIELFSTNATTSLWLLIPEHSQS